MSEVPPGWYPDPYGAPDLLRWWDGGEWTGETTPLVAEPAADLPTDHFAPPTTEFGTGTGASGGTALPASYDTTAYGIGGALGDDQNPDGYLPEGGWPGQEPPGSPDTGYGAGDPWSQQEPSGGGFDVGDPWSGRQQSNEEPTNEFGAGGQWQGQEQAGGEHQTEAFGSGWPGQGQGQGQAPQGGHHAGAAGSGQEQPGGSGGGGTPVIPTPWEQPAQAPGIEWEPQAEPPPFTTEHGPPIPDWEQQPSGATPWTGESQPPAGTPPWTGGEQPSAGTPPWTSESQAPAGTPPWTGENQPATGATPWTEESPPPAGVTPWGEESQAAVVTGHDVSPHPTAEPSSDDWNTQQQGTSQTQESSSQAAVAPPTFHWEEPRQETGSYAPPEQAPQQGTGGYEPPPAQWQPPESYEDYGEPRRRGKGLLVGGIAGGLALILILGVVGGILFVNRDDGPVTKPSNSATPSSSPSSQPPSSKPPAGPRVTAGGISYSQLSGQWAAPGATAVKELKPNLGQVQTTQKDAPSARGDWVAQVCVGTLTGFDYSGTGDLESTATALAKAVEDNYYSPLKTKREDVKEKRIEVSGKQGYQIQFHLDFVDPPDGFAAKGETVYVAVVDNDPKPAGVYLTIPDNKPELKPTIDDVVASLQVGS